MNEGTVLTRNHAFMILQPICIERGDQILIMYVLARREIAFLQYEYEYDAQHLPPLLIQPPNLHVQRLQDSHLIQRQAS